MTGTASCAARVEGCALSAAMIAGASASVAMTTISMTIDPPLTDSTISLTATPKSDASDSFSAVWAALPKVSTAESMVSEVRTS